MKKNNGKLSSRKINTQSLVVALVAIALAAFFAIVSPSFRKWPTIVTPVSYTHLTLPTITAV